AVAPYPQRRMRFLHGLGGKTDIAEAIKLAVELWVLRGPQLLEHAQHLIALAAASVERNPQGCEFFGPPANAKATNQPAVGQGINGGQHLGHDNGMPMPQDEDGGANASAFRTHRGGSQDSDGLQIRRLWRM